ncbi:MAG: 50S ribosomal protein L21e [Nanoarchaeota archaeon]|nr:50S ribosomal protein L21e [Nanoarchaeota archaeon]
MTQKTGGPRSKTRHKLRKNVRTKGKLRISNYLQEFKISDRVALVAEPAVQAGMHHPRFQGHIGVVAGKQGDVYKVKIKTGNMNKIFLVHPIHLRRQ